MSCSSWQKGSTCAGEGRPGDHGLADGFGEWHDWIQLDPFMRSTNWEQCEKLCKRYRENGCCYLASVFLFGGCFWNPGGYSIKPGNDVTGMSADCYRSGRNKTIAFDNQ